MSHLPYADALFRKARAGLTLLELVIVLVILAALTGIAVQSLQPVAEQARYEATQQTLINIDESIVTLSYNSDRVASYSGFVADLGRLPVAVGADPETQLAELWSQVTNAGTLSLFSITDFDDPDTAATETIPVAAGWRGPYLRLPPGPRVLRDGFGRAYGIFNTSGVTASSGDSIGNLVSAGANGTIDSMDVDYDRDLELPGGLWSTGRFQGTVEVGIKDASNNNPTLAAGQTLRLKLYGPDPTTLGDPGILEEQTLVGPSTGPVELTFTNQTVGPRVVVAYITTGTSPMQTVVQQSSPKQIVLAPGMNPSVTINLQ